MYAQLYMYSICGGKRIFPNIFYAGWIIGSNLSSIWTFAFANEMHVASLLIIGSKCFMLVLQLIAGMKTIKNKKGKVTDEIHRNLQSTVINSVAIVTVWCFTAYASIVTHALAWEYSAHLEVAVFRGLDKLR
uniref:Uncharacterized protein n=1 Tax=Ciona savignyi TaxID=51511 RepID=H2YC45_CIOSA